MKRTHEVDRLLIRRIRSGETDAWSELIARYEGRLLAFVNSRLSNRSASEDIVPVSYTHLPSPRDQRGSRMPSSA